MGSLFERRAASGLLAIALACGAPCAARALDVGPKNIPLTVAGIPVEIPVAGAIDVHTDADSITLKAVANGDLQVDPGSCPRHCARAEAAARPVRP